MRNWYELVMLIFIDGVANEKEFNQYHNTLLADDGIDKQKADFL